MYYTMYTVQTYTAAAAADGDHDDYDDDDDNDNDDDISKINETLINYSEQCDQGVTKHELVKNTKNLKKSMDEKKVFGRVTFTV